jgi:light-regulated signal transduction histidine kinase (bacteriophytochrome)
VTGIRSFRLDITARKRAEKALQEQAEKLVRSNAELEQFAYVASHDLQEPLRKIQAFGDRLKSKCGPELNSDAQDCLKRVQNAAARMQTLIQDLLSLSRVSSQTQPFVSVDLNELARAVISDLEIRIEQLGAHVEVAALPVVIGDRIQLAQLFLNLIGNALKFHKPGEPPWVKLWSERDQGQTDVWRIVIEDQGIGFDEKYLDRIFQIFQRLHGRTEYEGTGIGLAICSKIVDRHHGVITASSKPGEGAKFVVTLPCKSSRGEACNE